MHAADHTPMRTILLPDAKATEALGACLAQALQPGLAIWLCGDLGTGKTTLVRGLLRALGFCGRVKSPTFSLLEIYNFSSFNLYHFDLYRINDPAEWVEAGFCDYFNPAAVCVVEWPERGEGVLPAPDVVIRLSFAGQESMARQAELGALTEAGRQCWHRLEGGRLPG